MYRYMGVLAVVLVLSLAGAAHAITVDGDLSDWGAWTGPSFSAYDLYHPAVGSFTGYNVGDSLVRSTWANENNVLTTYFAGGEWYDIEGLYVSVTHDVIGGVTHSYLNWAIITSYAGMEYGEWYPNNWAAADPKSNGTYTHGSGPLAGQRDGGANGHDYHENPVIGLSFDGDSSASYEWGIVLGETTNPTLHQRDASLSTTPTLYKINDAGVWQYWVDSVDFPVQEKAVDFDEATGGGKVDAKVTGGVGSSVRVWDSAHSESINPLDPNYMTDYPAQPGHPDAFRMDYTWIWEGSMDVTGSGLSVAGLPVAHYSMWCGNDGILTQGDNYNGPTPELSTWALLGCTGLLGLCSVGWRRRRLA